LDERNLTGKKRKNESGKAHDDSQENHIECHIASADWLKGFLISRKDASNGSDPIPREEIPWADPRA
jgi:hypothetical protein